MTVQHVNVAEGGQAIVGNANAPAEGGGARGKTGDQPHALRYAPGIPLPREIEAERVAVPSAGCAGGMSNARGWRRGSEGQQDGAMVAESFALKREVKPLPGWRARRRQRLNRVVATGRNRPIAVIAEPNR
jgi:hypothetical protein